MITGATAGFGRAIAVKFAQNRYNIIITGRRKERLVELENELAVYTGIDALKAEDIADVVYYCANVPPHVCINVLEITPTQEAGVNHSVRKVRRCDGVMV